MFCYINGCLSSILVSDHRPDVELVVPIVYAHDCNIIGIYLSAALLMRKGFCEGMKCCTKAQSTAPRCKELCKVAASEDVVEEEERGDAESCWSPALSLEWHHVHHRSEA